ncbi:c-type cytochrome [Rubidibacter lacunae]|uniref:c-type cytochrome n=1 Tax=Rubidibacter lacunae TaxID=582514 RepID=UPI0004059710|nr:cytochrome c [Rubidibacter lacunae]
MDEPLAQPSDLARRLAAVLVVVVLALVVAFVGTNLYRLSDPYVREVLALTSNPERGEAIFQINCAGCHGRGADGNVGPSLHNLSQRKSEFDIIHQVTSGKTPPMPEFQPTSQEMADLLGYLETL